MITKGMVAPKAAEDAATNTAHGSATWPKAQAARSAASNALRLHRRRDVEVRCHQVRGRLHYVVKDPIALRFHQLTHQEHFLWDQLDGVCSREEICRRFEQRFPSIRLTPRELEQFVGKLHRDGLVIAEATEQGDVLYERSRQSRRRQQLLALANPLAIRLPSCNPRRVFDRLEPVGRLVFSPAAVSLGSLLILTCGMLALLQFQEFSTRLGETPWGGWLAPLLALSLLKICHELGHGLLCRRYGRECHELGAMLLFFTPCLYCNVTDSWMLSSKWQRAAVAAAGVWVELVLASLCGLLWWFSEPGWFHQFSAYVMLIGSLNSLMLNGNPLLRFDGYYVLADLWEYPNLGPRSQWVLRDFVWQLLFGIPPTHREAAEDRRRLLAYGLAALLYRLLLIAALLTAAYWFLKPYRLTALLGLVALPLAAFPLVRLGRRIRDMLTNPAARRQVRRRNLIVATAVIAAMIGAACVPLPRTVNAVGRVRFLNERVVRAPVAGRIVEAQEEGSQVSRGTVIAKLKNDELSRQLAELREEEIQLKLQIEELQAVRQVDPEATAKVPTLREKLAGVRRELASRQTDVDRLQIIATQSGTIVAPPPTAPDSQEGQLPLWTGTPLRRENRGCYLERGEVLCVLGDPRAISVMAEVGPAAIGQLAVGQPVRVRWRGAAEGVNGQVARISQPQAQPQAQSQSQASGGGGANERPPAQEARYSVWIHLTPPHAAAPIGMQGKVKIRVPPASIAHRVGRWLERTFRFRT